MLLNLVPGLINSDNQPGSLFYRHPEYDRKWWWREFGRVSYMGGLEYHHPALLSIEFQYPTIEDRRNSDGQLVEKNAVVNLAKQVNRSLLFRHDREKIWEYENRKRRAYYYNFVRTVVNSLVAHATNRPATRVGDDLADKFWDGVDPKRTMGMDHFMESGLQQAQVQGVMWACVDADQGAGVKDTDPYAYWVSPLDILDWDVGADGEIAWLKQFCYVEQARDWNVKVEPKYQFRIWTKKDVTTYQTTPAGGDHEILSVVDNKIGRVPFVPLFSLRDDDKLFPDGTPLCVDLCKCANHIYNLTSLLSEILYKQTFSWLAIPDKNVDTLQMGVNTAFGYDPGQSSARPMYLSPDPRQAEVLMQAINAAIEQARQSVGVGRGRSDASMQVQSSDAILLESEDKRSILGDIAAQAEDFEGRLMDMVLSYRKGGAPKEKPLVRYATDFDLRSLQDEIDEAISLRSLGVSDEVNQEIMEQLVRRKFSNTPPKQLDDLIKSMQPKKPVPGGAPGSPGAPPAVGDAPPPDPALSALATTYLAASAKKQPLNGA